MVCPFYGQDFVGPRLSYGTICERANTPAATGLLLGFQHSERRATRRQQNSNKNSATDRTVAVNTTDEAWSRLGAPLDQQRRRRHQVQQRAGRLQPSAPGRGWDGQSGCRVVVSLNHPVPA